MVKRTFFGKSTALTVQSSAKEDPFVYFTVFRKKSDDIWERPSEGEGKTVKMNQNELAEIIGVINKKRGPWETTHPYKNEQTKISVNWQENEKNKLWINIGKYNKLMNFADSEIFLILLKELLKEKIMHAIPVRKKEETNYAPEKVTLDENQTDKSSIKKQNKQEHTELKGSISGETEKALLIKFESGLEVWIPKSTIYSRFESEKDKLQSFSIANWILVKNKVIQN